MRNLIFFLLLFFTPLYASQTHETREVVEKLEALFGSDLASDLEEAGLDMDTACELMRLVLMAKNQPIPAASIDMPLVPVWDVALPVDWRCFFETESRRPLIICPEDAEAASRFMQVAKENRPAILSVLKRYGAIVFSGFDFTLHDFPAVFEAVTGVSPTGYGGDTPREEVAKHVYKSTAVAPAHHIGLHQEDSGSGLAFMPRYLGFYCATPPKSGTGRTLVASAKDITYSIQKQVPDLWDLMNQNLITWAFYLPERGFWTKITKMLNPSHATVREKFGTDDPGFIQKWCQERGHTCFFEKGGVKIFHKPVPGVVKWDDEPLFCNQIHLNVRSAHLCGGALNKAIADLLLYEQFGVQKLDGTPITPEQADRLSRVIREQEDGRDWKAGEIMIFDNVGALHGKTPHTGERKVFATMGGRVNP